MIQNKENIDKIISLEDIEEEKSNIINDLKKISEDDQNEKKDEPDVDEKDEKEENGVDEKEENDVDEEEENLFENNKNIGEKRKRIEEQFSNIDIASLCYDKGLNDLGDKILSEEKIKIDFQLLIKYSQDRKFICKILKTINNK
jgi:hypothetical protein